jgi:hypothetical protein
MSFNVNESFNVHEMGSIVPESYSRKLDERVLIQEMTYGYTGNPPPADTGDFDQAKLESKKAYKVRGGRIS